MITFASGVVVGFLALWLWVWLTDDDENRLA